MLDKMLPLAVVLLGSERRDKAAILINSISSNRLQTCVCISLRAMCKLGNTQLILQALHSNAIMLKKSITPDKRKEI